ncbi:hypothetical protein NHF48_007270 [Sphingomonas sp. H160509]|uniref:hypothetical protein n=1 Tax=Sphingomonas sp. H160509 TaxID=2955313 RepID=UPI00209758B9|nr:hypothetical protein [Sphingomonas sp. H160509]MDD1450801.1 hypothetical protein [Sphingomonas sp. H160509]
MAPTAGTVVRVANVARGTGDGTSWSNAMAFSELTRAIVAAGPGGTVHVEAQNGPITAYANVRAGGLENQPVLICGVNSATGENWKAVHDGGRGPLIDAGKSFARPLTVGGGMMRMHHAYSAFTVNPANDIFTLPTTETWHALVTGSRVRLTTTGILPGGSAANTDYFVIKLANAQQAKLATSPANAAAGVAIDVTDAGTGVHTLTAIAATRTFTANAADETITVDPITYAEVRTGQIVYLSNTGGALPANYTADRPYCVIKTATPNVLRLSGSTRGANMVARIAFDPATDQLTFPGTNSKFARWFVTGEPGILRSNGTLPANLTQGQTVYAVRSGANGKQGGTFKISATPNGAAIDIVDAGTGIHTIEAPSAVIKISDAGSGAHGIRLGHVEVGPNFLTFKNLIVQNGGPGGSINFATTSKGVTFEDIDAENLYRLIENSGYLGTSSGDASILDLVVRNCHLYGTERSFSRLRYSSLDAVFENVSGDSRRVFGDPFASLFSLEPTSFTAVAGASNACGPCRVTYSRVKISRAYQDGGTAYWNGDGGEDNGASYGNMYRFVESDWHTDGSFDCKGTCNEYLIVYGGFSKRIARIWGKGVYIADSLFAQFQRVGEQYGENGSGALIWVGSVAYPEEGSYNATVEMENVTLEEFTGAPLIIGGADFTAPYPMLITNHTIRRRPNSPILEKIDPNSAFFDPPIATQGPQLTSPSSFVIEKTGSLNTTLTFVVPNSTLQNVVIEGGDDVDDFALAGLVLTTGTLNIAAPADSDKDNVYRIVLRATAANGNYTLVPITVSVVAVLPTIRDFNYDDGNLNATGSADFELVSGLAGAIQVQDGHINCVTTSSGGGIVRDKKVLASSNLYHGITDIGMANWGSLVCVRMVGSDYLGFRWQSNINETGTIQIFRYINGILTLVVATPNPVPRPLNNETIIEARLNPVSNIDECRVLMNGDEVIQWTPTGLTGAMLTSTRVGYHGRSALTVPWIDNAKIGILS